MPPGAAPCPAAEGGLGVLRAPVHHEVLRIRKAAEEVGPQLRTEGPAANDLALASRMRPAMLGRRPRCEQLVLRVRVAGGAAVAVVGLVALGHLAAAALAPVRVEHVVG